MISSVFSIKYGKDDFVGVKIFLALHKPIEMKKLRYTCFATLLFLIAGCSVLRTDSGLSVYKKEGYKEKYNSDSSYVLYFKPLQDIATSRLAIVVTDNKGIVVFEDENKYHSAIWKSRYELQLLIYRGINLHNAVHSRNEEDNNVRRFTYYVNKNQLTEDNQKIP